MATETTSPQQASTAAPASLTSSNPNTSLLAPYYLLSWKNWSDNAGQHYLNREDGSKIEAQHFYAGAQDSGGHDLFIARKLAEEPESDFVPASTAKLVAAGEYHPADNIDCGRMISNGEFQLEKSGYQVLVAEVATMNYNNYDEVFQLEWVEINLENGETPESVGGQFLVSGQDASGVSLYVARGWQEGKGFAVGTYPKSASEATFPWKSGVFTLKTFSLLRIIPASLQRVQAKMVEIAYSSYADDLTSTSLDNLGLLSEGELQNACTFYGATQVSLAGFDLSPENVRDINITEASEYMNVACVAEDGQGGLILSFRGTLSDFGEVTGGTYYDWANNFIAGQVSLTLDGNTLGVHAGIYYATLAVLGTDKIGVYQYINERIKKGETLSIAMGGHSKGGAMCNIAALLLKSKYGDAISLEVATFGAPKVGNQLFAAIYDEQIRSSYSYIYRADFVPWLPFDVEMEAFVTYQYHNIYTALGSTFSTWLISWAESAISANSSLYITDVEPLESSNGSPNIALGSAKETTIEILVNALISGLFGVGTAFIPTVQDYVIDKAAIDNMLSILNTFDITKDIPDTDQDGATMITDIFRFIYKNLLGPNKPDLGEELKNNVGLVELGSLTIFLAIADVAGATWVADLKKWKAYEASTNFANFLDEIVPLAVKIMEAYGDASKSIAMDYRYARVGHTRYLFEENGSSSLVTCDGIAPSFFFSNLLQQLNIQNIKDKTIETNNPERDHSAYKSLFRLS